MEARRDVLATPLSDLCNRREGNYVPNRGYVDFVDGDWRRLEDLESLADMNTPSDIERHQMKTLTAVTFTRY